MPDQQPVPTPRKPRVIAAPQRRQPSPADPCAMVIFGAGGDLTKRLVVPALYNLSHTKVLPEKFALIGVDPIWTRSTRLRGTSSRRRCPTSRAT